MAKTRAHRIPWMWRKIQVAYKLPGWWVTALRNLSERTGTAQAVIIQEAVTAAHPKDFVQPQEQEQELKFDSGGRVSWLTTPDS